MTRDRFVLALLSLAAVPAWSWTGSTDEPGRFPPLQAESGRTAADTPTAGPATRLRAESHAPDEGALAAAPPRLDVVGEPTASGYLLRVKVGGGQPDQVQVTPSGQSLTLSLRTGSSRVEEGRVGDGSGYRASSSGSHGAVRRKVPLPADADLRHLTRESSGDTLLLRIPRTAGRRAAPGTAAAPKPHPSTRGLD